jgi:hypothetical protein
MLDLHTENFKVKAMYSFLSSYFNVKSQIDRGARTSF